MKHDHHFNEEKIEKKNTTSTTIWCNFHTIPSAINLNCKAKHEYDFE